ncbi:hypothetical protein [Rubritalea tangerina]|uniref:Uncharacterized protein n=1 Tax=Rubritalea tangerina TaxID=430798 RepID=A0ABW4ZDM7_9BACT
MTPYWTLSLLTLLLPHSLIANTFQQQVTNLKNQPTPSVFRSVINDRPRMLTILLSDSHAISYDTGIASIGLAWKSHQAPPVNLIGAVYNGKHGPQPTTNGNMLLVNAKPEFSTPLGSIHFLSHSFKEDKIILRYAIKDSSGTHLATIEEIPQWHQQTLSRSIRLTPAHLGSKVTFTPAAGLHWKYNNQACQSLNLAQNRTVTTSL